MIKRKKVKLPGVHKPFNSVSGTTLNAIRVFPTALDLEHINAGRLGRPHIWKEIQMLRVMNDFTELENWDSLIFEETSSKYLTTFFRSHGLKKSKETVDWIINELKWRAAHYKRTKRVNVFDGVLKSDKVISADLRQALTDATRPLIHARQTNWKCEYQVPLDPQSFPLAWESSRVLTDHKIRLEDSLSSVGWGDTIFLKGEDRAFPHAHLDRGTVPLDIGLWGETFSGYDLKQQYLPFDVKLTPGGCSVVSYINGLHPQVHAEFYNIMERLINQAIPMWNESLSQTKTNWHRLHFANNMLQFCPPMPQWEPQRCNCADEMMVSRLSPHSCELCEREFRPWLDSRHISLPEPKPFADHMPTPNTVNLRKFINGIQVIAKLEHVDLSPGGIKTGDNWHVEGALNEHICATAVFCYDVDNISIRKIRFRQRSDPDPALKPESFVGDVPLWVNAFNWETIQKDVLNCGGPLHLYPSTIKRYSVVQELGKISLTEGKMIAFPSMLQHRCSRFSTIDKTKPGSCNVLSLFLVDPHIRIVSTANVPPQRKDWWGYREQLICSILRQRLPQELVDMVFDQLDHEEASFTNEILDAVNKRRFKLARERIRNGRDWDFVEAVGEGTYWGILPRPGIIRTGSVVNGW